MSYETCPICGGEVANNRHERECRNASCPICWVGFSSDNFEKLKDAINTIKRRAQIDMIRAMEKEVR